MKIYEIENAISDLLSQVDEETGEILFDPEQLEALQMERDGKIENLVEPPLNRVCSSLCTQFPLRMIV